EPFPARDLVVFLSFALIAVTLVGQGLSLAPLIRTLGIGGDWNALEEVRHARLALARTALVELGKLEPDCGVADPLVAHLRTEYQNRIEESGTHELVMAHEYRSPLRRLRLDLLAAERRELLRLWHEDAIGDAALHELERELDFEESRLSS